jgi:hypothetical protein
MNFLIAKSLKLLTIALILAASAPLRAQVCVVSSTAPPVVLYTDISAGPNTGGENNKGIYLSIFGKNFGDNGLGSTVRVYINNVEVDQYRFLGNSRGRPDIQQIIVQIGALGNPAVGVPLPISVVVDGVASNADQTFTVNPGNIYFVDALNGVDTATINSGGGFTDPFKSVQKAAGMTTSFAITPASTTGAWGRVRAGDFVVLRGGTYTDVGFGGSASGEGFFVQTLNKSGCPIGIRCAQGGGNSSGPITFMGYPGETAYINRTNSGAGIYGGGFSSADSARQAAGYGAWINVVNLKIESGFADGPINTQRAEDNPLGGNWRVVNNELTAYSCANITLCRGGAIAGSGTGNFWVGNNGHDIYDKPDANTSLENHGIYIGGSGSFEIAYNVFSRIRGGNGIQVQSFANAVASLSIHHNIISDTGKHGLNLAAGAGNRVEIWNNIINGTDYAGARFGDDAMRNVKLYNNTFYDLGRAGNAVSGAAWTNDTNAAAGMFDIRNNIVWASAAAGYAGGCCNVNYAGNAAIFSNNLWFGAGAPPVFDMQPQSGNPNFVAPGMDFRLNTGSPAIDKGSSAVTALVKDDFDVTTATGGRTVRPIAAAVDIGAFEKR